MHNNVCNKRRLVIVFCGLGDGCLRSLSQDRDHSKYVTLQWIYRNHFASNDEYVSFHCVVPIRENAVTTIYWWSCDIFGSHVSVCRNVLW